MVSLTDRCPFCSGFHLARDPCPEQLAAATATVQKHTLGTRAPVTLKQLEESVRVVENLIKTQRWTLVSPSGEMWVESDPKKLVSVLLSRISSSFMGHPVKLHNMPATAHYPLTLEGWKAKVSRKYLNAQFEAETGDGKTYGGIGTITAHIGPDMQSDVIGVWVPGSHCSIGDTDYEVGE